MQLSQELLAEFGGMRAVVAHFKAAPTSEACRNLLAVMLDHVIYHLTQVTYSLWSVLGDTFKMANILEASFALCTVQSFHTDASQLISLMGKPLILYMCLLPVLACLVFVQLSLSYICNTSESFLPTPYSDTSQTGRVDHRHKQQQLMSSVLCCRMLMTTCRVPIRSKGLKA